MSIIFESNFWKIFTDSTVTTPAHEIMLLLLLSTICLVTRWTRMGLLISFVYVYRWGWLFMHREFGSHHTMLVVYYITGIVVLISSVIAFLMQKD